MRTDGTHYLFGLRNRQQPQPRETYMPAEVVSRLPSRHSEADTALHEIPYHHSISLSASHHKTANREGEKEGKNADKNDSTRAQSKAGGERCKTRACKNVKGFSASSGVGGELIHPKTILLRCAGCNDEMIVAANRYSRPRFCIDCARKLGLTGPR